MTETKRRKVMIVVEETGANDGRGFNVYLSGDKDRIGKIQDVDLSPAEFWGSRLFQICIDACLKAGAVKTVDKKGVH